MGKIRPSRPSRSRPSRSGKGAVKIQGRKSRSENAYGKHWNKESNRYEKTLKVCSGCGRKGTQTNPVQRHHTIPLSKGGHNLPIFMKLLCKLCHDKRHRK